MSDNNVKIEIGACVTRVETPGGQRLGTGFVIAFDPATGPRQALAVTCAHVVDAGGIGPGGRARLVFRANAVAVKAEVLAGGYHSQADVAFLRLLDPLPAGVVPAVLAPAAGRDGARVRAFGYPAVGDVDGLWGSGELDGRVTQTGRPLLQLRSTQITTGFSGGPVWEGASGRVIAMVASVTVPDHLARLGDVAFAIPAETLRDQSPVPLELRAVEPKSNTDVPTGGIRAGRIQARNVVSGVQLQGGVPPDVAGLAELAQALRRGGIEADEIEADSIVDGLQFTAGPPPDTPTDDDKGG